MWTVLFIVKTSWLFLAGIIFIIKGKKQIEVVWKNSFPPYKKNIQIDTKIDQSEYKLSIDLSEASIIICFLLVNFYFILIYLFIHVFNLFTFCEQNFEPWMGRTNF